MPKSQSYAHPRVAAGVPSIGKFSGGIIWGIAAGAVIGAGMSLNIDLFFGSATGATCASIVIFAFLGALLGHVMAHLFSDSKLGYAGHVAAGRHHRITEIPAQTIDLSDYRTLKAETPKRSTSIPGAPAALHPAHTAAMIPPQKMIQGEARL